MLSTVVSKKFLVWKLFGFVPLDRIRIDRIRSMRAASYSEIFYRQPRRVFRTRYWPSLTTGYGRRMNGFYVIKTDTGKRIFCRLKSGTHFVLRSRIGKPTD